MAPNTSQTQTRGSTARRGRETNEQEFDEMTGELNTQSVHELLCEALATEIGGIKIYETAIECAQNDDLREEWNKYLEETQNHERILREVHEKLGIEFDESLPGVKAVVNNGDALVETMTMAKGGG